MVIASALRVEGPANGSVSVVSDRDDGWLDSKSGGPGCDAAEEASTRSEMTIQSLIPIDLSSPNRRYRQPPSRQFDGGEHDSATSRF